jgi:HEAT repeat protein
MFRNRFRWSAGITIIIICIFICFGYYIATDSQNTSVGKRSPEDSNKGIRGESFEFIPETPSSSDSDIVKIDLRKSYEVELKKMGVSNFSTKNLARILDGNEVFTKKMFVAWYFRESNDVKAIPALERALGDESDYVKIASAEALLKMGNKKGIPVMEKMCMNFSKEYEAGNRKNFSHLECAAAVLASAGEASAIPYLRQLAAEPNVWSVRLYVLRSLSELAEKDPNVITDINRMKNDEHPQVRKEATKFMNKIEAKKQ